MLEVHHPWYVVFVELANIASPKVPFLFSTSNLMDAFYSTGKFFFVTAPSVLHHSLLAVSLHVPLAVLGLPLLAIDPQCRLMHFFFFLLTWGQSRWLFLSTSLLLYLNSSHSNCRTLILFLSLFAFFPLSLAGWCMLSHKQKQQSVTLCLQMNLTPFHSISCLLFLLLGQTRGVLDTPGI